MMAVSFSADRAPALRRGRGWFGRLGPLAIICLVHAALLVWLTATLARPPVVVSPPAVIGELVSDAPAVSAPKPLPMAPAPNPRPKPEPKPKPVVRPKPVARPPLPKAPPSEHAVSIPPPTPPTAASPPSDSHTNTAAATAPATSGHSEDAPVTPPRSDASSLNNPAPEYPPQSRTFHEQGRVLLDVYILPNGTVGQIKLHQSSGYSRLDNSALDAVRRWHYIPAKRGDEPIPYWYVQPIDFELDQ